ncbi:hydrolase 1, exosortase A system-associated [Pedomonas sp. V897]|uniref:hydrolase 1, exosortase A system-associated n=1 Tax=Pedomonas sp. V897 TaxID=3446482 RepID=UPI003EE2BF52
MTLPFSTTPPACKPLVFPCEDAPLVGALHPAESAARLGVVIAAGGVQVRAGPHRSHVDLAQFFAAEGLPTLRFDRRGIGDSGGTDPGFEMSGPDISAAITALCTETGVEGVIGYGLCDGATALGLLAPYEPRLAGLILTNPWTIDEADQANSLVMHHYRRRMRDPRQLGRLLRGEIALGPAIRSLGRSLSRVALDRLRARPRPAILPLGHRLAKALGAFTGPIHIILSDHDRTAAAFEAGLRLPAWKAVLERPNVTVQHIGGADHTFSPTTARAALLAECRAAIRAMAKRESEPA